MYQQFNFQTEICGQVEILRLKGYLEDSGGAVLLNHIHTSLDRGISLFGFDCSEIKLISSPGIAVLLDVSEQIIDNFAGKIAVWDIDKHHTKVLEISGVFFLMNQVSNQQEALNYLNDDNI